MLLDTQITLGTVVLVEHFPESETNLSSIAMQEPDELLLESSQLVSKSPKTTPPTNLTLVYEVVLSDPQSTAAQAPPEDHAGEGSNANTEPDEDFDADEEDEAALEELNVRLSRCNDSEDDIIFEDDGSDDEVSFEEPQVETPTWFAFEEPEQIKAIFETYTENLKLKEEQKRCIREPPKFIGRVKRSKVQSDDALFQTLDACDVFRRALVSPGSLMPFVKTAYLLTTWSIDDGVPQKCVCLSPSKRKQWEAKLELSEPPSYLYCEPVFFTSTEYDFFVETEDRDVRHSSKSYLHRAYENHIPVFTYANKRKLCLSPNNGEIFED